jgi:serine/threonine-protein kinase
MAMNKILKKQVTRIQPGTIIRGKFKKQTYEIKAKLGEGAIGTVYLCQRNGRTFALKISEKQTSMTIEVNVLKAIAQVQGNSLGPVLIEVDDWISPYGKTYTFYVMEYVKGESISHFIRNNGHQWLGPLMMQLLEKLEALHQAGWVYGDLKTDNLLVASPSPQMRWVDVGGMTQIGRSVKEYTEFYDRGYWGMGSRRAEPSYDLFSFVMIFLEVYYPRRFSRPEQGKEKYLFKKIDKVAELHPYAMILKKAVAGKYPSAAQMKTDLQRALLLLQKRKARKQKTSFSSSGLLEMVWISFLSLFYLLFSIIMN